MPDTPLLGEKFLSSVPLALPDAMGYFPLTVGLLSLINVELSRRMTAQRNKAVKETEFVKRHTQSKKPGANPAPSGPTTNTLVQTSKGWEVVKKAAPQQRDTVVEELVNREKVDPETQQVNKLAKVAERIGQGGAILMIGISMLSPGVWRHFHRSTIASELTLYSKALTLCWVTSSSFSILKTLAEGWYEKRYDSVSYDSTCHVLRIINNPEEPAQLTKAGFR